MAKSSITPPWPLASYKFHSVKIKMPNGAKNYAFTLNNPTEDELVRLSALPVEASFLLYGKEIGESGTFHLQGTVGFHKRRSLAQAKAIISDPAHFEVVRNLVASIEYCRKEGDVTELGVIPVSNPAGKRSDLEDFKSSVRSGVLSLAELRETHSEIIAKYPRFCFDYVRDHSPKREVEDFPLRPWQQELADILKEDLDSRTIVFVVDTTGNSGKSWFCDWFESRNPGTQLILPGKKADMAYSLDPSIRVLMVDAPRSKQGEFIQYDFLEEVKNGRVFSGKYESGMKRLGKVHVVVMMNEQPDMTKLSSDRYLILDI